VPAVGAGSSEEPLEVDAEAESDVPVFEPLTEAEPDEEVLPHPARGNEAKAKPQTKNRNVLDFIMSSFFPIFHFSLHFFLNKIRESLVSFRFLALLKATTEEKRTPKVPFS
jgi:hypothetical protein